MASGIHLALMSFHSLETVGYPYEDDHFVVAWRAVWIVDPAQDLRHPLTQRSNGMHKNIHASM
jgi:hypothetical protein